MKPVRGPMVTLAYYFPSFSILKLLFGYQISKLEMLCPKNNLTHHVEYIILLVFRVIGHWNIRKHGLCPNIQKNWTLVRVLNVKMSNLVDLSLKRRKI